MTAQELQALLDEAAEAPAWVKGNIGEVRQHRLTDLLKLAEHLERRGEGVSRPHRGLRITKLSMPGAV